ncbi:ATP-binding protein [Streptomyces roseolilacinus]|uniref:ATP-binding protein n=1 Tax=Streptomyces roseolilacinus TaxID=66904 RepID=A0A918AYP6_9ACTN|nr:ATP-binding protein [Streptomyces roseolilacinus]GGP88946.1 ATP-binding protein [Streptomyces roseolilacinus]
MIGVSDTDGACAEWTFPGRPDAVRTARRAVRDTLRDWRLDAALGDIAVLLVSELVTNSLRHARGPVGLRISRPPASHGPLPPHAALLVEVSDPVPDPPRTRPAGPDDESGRGLGLVACSARRWGTRKGRAGKTVWFELPLPG